MNKMRKIKQITILFLLVAVLLMATVFTGYVHHRAGEIGSAIGQINGKLVGTALGSARGATVGAKEGKELERKQVYLQKTQRWILKVVWKLSESLKFWLPVSV